MSNNDIKALIDKYQIRAKKKLGQNFITDSNIIRKMVNLSNISSASTVIEIGPGLGILTKELAKQARQVIAYEIDSKLVLLLKERFLEDTNIEIIEADFLSLDIKQELEKRKIEKAVVCANLPYYITTPLLFKLFEGEACIDSIAVMMQKEVAQRFTAIAGSKDYNALSVITLKI